MCLMRSEMIERAALGGSDHHVCARDTRDANEIHSKSSPRGWRLLSSASSVFDASALSLALN